MNEFNIAGRQIGDTHLPLIIAEIGINHEGSLKTAIEMAAAAIKAGAEVIKHQTHIVDDEYSPIADKVIPSNADDSIYQIMKRCSLTENEELTLKQYIEDSGAIFISTPFSKLAVDRLISFDVPAFKIGSGECNNYELVEYIAKTGKPIILSTGMNDIESVEKSVLIFRKYNIQFALLHCTNVYPTPPQLVRLGAIRQLQEKFSDAVIGLSDHTTSNYTSFASVALGGSIIERHFTDNKSRPGPDIICSMDPNDFIDLKNGVETIFVAKGGIKGIVDEELPTAKFAFASIVAKADLSHGTILSKENITLKRPGLGDFFAKDFNKLCGRKLSRNLKKDDMIKKEDVS
ncbi:N-acetylneuraminate synthase family protein [Alphaproteobacteria bacterium]|nr:N-acetylneuraminate synthase family protein [Alphaproteobacteria bacterium]